MLEDYQAWNASTYEFNGLFRQAAEECLKLSDVRAAACLSDSPGFVRARRFLHDKVEASADRITVPDAEAASLRRLTYEYTNALRAQFNGGGTGIAPQSAVDQLRTIAQEARIVASALQARCLRELSKPPSICSDDLDRVAEQLAAATAEATPAVAASAAVTTKTPTPAVATPTSAGQGRAAARASTCRTVGQWRLEAQRWLYVSNSRPPTRDAWVAAMAGAFGALGGVPLYPASSDPESALLSSVYTLNREIETFISAQGRAALEPNTAEAARLRMNEMFRMVNGLLPVECSLEPLILYQPG